MNSQSPGFSAQTIWIINYRFRFTYSQRTHPIRNTVIPLLCCAFYFDCIRSGALNLRCLNVIIDRIAFQQPFDSSSQLKFFVTVQNPLCIIRSNRHGKSVIDCPFIILFADREGLGFFITCQ